ncbi:hypothetical protein Pfo_015208 [Paulownia fortunei]|nr:hypothetical protein Pfo_015208 [Paulownia fortunei]
MVTIKLHYGGYFELGPSMHMISMTELKQWIDQLGLSKNANVYYLVPNTEFDVGLRMILSYTDIVVIFKEYEAYDVISNTCIDDENIEILHDVQVNLNNDNGKMHICVEDIPIDDEYVLGDTHNMFDSSLDSFEGNEYDGIEGEQEPDDRDACFYASDSDLNDTPLNSHEEADNADPVFNEAKDMENPKLRLGMIYKDATIFKTALREYSIKKGYDFKFIKNESDRITVVCADDCPFRVHASKMQGSKIFQIKSLREHSIYPRRYKLKSATSIWLANKYLNKLIDDPQWKPKAMKKAVRREQNIFVSINQIYRAKWKALEAIEGDHRKDFYKVRGYCGMVKKMNPGSVATITRLFLQYSAQIKGFLAGCRPVIGLDACHLKGSYSGQLMHAIGRDGNNQMFPLAMAVVEAENKDSWTWFLSLLNDIIGRPEEMGWIYILDKQKGLTETFKSIMHDVEHRFYIRHLYANFKNLYKGEDLKQLEFKKHMDELKALNMGAYEWLIREHPSSWARSYFSTNTKCDMISNNISESFDQYINDSRDKPIITMMEMIRQQLMTRFQENKELTNNMSGEICPKIMKNLEQTKFESTNCEVRLARNLIFEVYVGIRSFIVDMKRSHCSCKKIDPTGIPCLHACAAIMHDRRRVEEFVHRYYWKETYMKSYEHMIYPIPYRLNWDEVDCELFNPPKFRKAPGRPKKTRKRAPDEPKNTSSIRRLGKRIKCSNYDEFGHNKLSCKNPPKLKKNTTTTTDSTVSVENFFHNTNIATASREGSNITITGRERGRGRKIMGHGNPIGPNGQFFIGEPATTTKVKRVRGRGSTTRVIPSGNDSAQSSSVSSLIGAEKVIKRSTRFGDILFSQSSGNTQI